jgi:uncharacterized protein (TIGR03086 family)
MAGLVHGVPDDGPAEALGWPTPCERYTVGDLLDHISGAAIAFRAAAVKEPLDAAPVGDAANLGDDWRTRIPRDLLALADAWRAADAWTGMTAAGRVDLPGDVAGLVALGEIVIHGWDLAKATGQSAEYDGPELEAVHQMVRQFRADNVEGLFGPPVSVPEDAPLLDRIVGLAGRDPNWAPPG